ncbi:MAG: rRNA maturation RNase YbeY [Clostridia bacterium]|nr:rRNA maturation RNase YbeY [Clostridia bacterium]
MAELKIECFNKKIHLRKIAEAVYSTLGQKDDLKVELGFVSEQEIQEYNRQTRGVDKVTDVLSYPTLDGVCGKVLYKKDFPTDLDGKYLFLGSIILCEQKIKSQAKEYGHSEKRERDYLIVHGLMHLFGYDHTTDQDKALMREKEKQALKILGIEQ